ncbi:MAG: DUF4349 domain-containing protein [Firmicutes bacterium]|nr:DUF4349 domain-containing protein [Bacillota bacterium]
MNCRIVQENLSLYLDGQLSSSQLKVIAAHLESCASCRAEYSSLEQTVNCLRNLEPLTAPTGLKKKILNQIEEIDEKPHRWMLTWKNSWKYWGHNARKIGAAVVIIAALLLGKTILVPNLDFQRPVDLSGPTVESGQTEMAIPKEQTMHTMQGPAQLQSKELVRTDRVTDRKVIQTARLALLVEQLDKAMSAVEELAQKKGGFVQSSDLFRFDDARGANYTLRIPVDQLDGSLDQLEKLGEVQDRQTSAQDVTEEYIDIEARRRNLSQQEERLLSILAQAATVEDILQVETHLERVRGEVEALTGRLQYLENQTALSTLDIELRERSRSITTVQLPHDRLGTRLKEAFTGSINLLLSCLGNFALYLAAALPFLLLGSAIGAFGWLLYRRIALRK